MIFIGVTSNTCWELILYSKRKLFTWFSRGHIASNGVWKVFITQIKLKRTCLKIRTWCLVIVDYRIACLQCMPTLRSQTSRPTAARPCQVTVTRHCRGRSTRCQMARHDDRRPANNWEQITPYLVDHRNNTLYNLLVYVKLNSPLSTLLNLSWVYVGL